MLQKIFSFLIVLAISSTSICSAAPPVAALNNSESITPDLRIDESELTQFVETEHSQAEDDAANSQGIFKSLQISLLPEPTKTAESVNLEVEGIPSKVLSTYDKTQQKVTDLTEPLPILDTISEHEKYGNNGDMFDGISRSIVNGYEAFSNLLNVLIQKPKEIARSISKGITAKLDIIGGKIVGL